MTKHLAMMVLSLTTSSANPADTGQVSPNGLEKSSPRKIVFDVSREDWKASEIYAINPDGSNLRELTNTTGDGKGNRVPDWSPDGMSIVFSSNRDAVDSLDEEWDIYVMNADGSCIRRIVQHDGTDGAPAWSPDGKTIVFVSQR
ncbi:MAG: PD40 domain-containing protein, partial [Planctomycetes bacterium]|nr:PD40 domain-containing protein [Planctomycetota bacterium]